MLKIHNYAVAVICDDSAVGHVPRRISAACALFLLREGNIKCTITGSRRYSIDLPQGGLELPCLYTFSGNAMVVSKLIPAAAVEQSEEKYPQIRIIDVTEGSDDVLIIETWLTYRGIQLMSRDKAMLRSEQLTDLHIDFAQEILKKQFPRIYGLESTLLITRSSKLPKLPKNSLFLQIVHSRGNHWIAISALGPALEVQVYDSIYDNIDKETQKLCINLFCAGTKVERGCCMQQNGSTDCGVYAIAACTALAHSKRPLLYNSEGMRNHLINCFENLLLTPF